MFFRSIIHLLAISLIALIMLQTAAVGQNTTCIASTETAVYLRKKDLPEKRTPSHMTFATFEEADSLVAKRNFFSTTVIHQGKRLNRRSVIRLMEDEDVTQGLLFYNQSLILKPVGPLLIASGLVIGYVAVKGTQKTAFAKGIGTPANPSPPDVLVEYTSRSLPMLLGGVGLLVGGLCLIEISSGLTAKSISLYNAQVFPRRSVSSLQSIKLGITASGHLGFEANF